MNHRRPATVVATGVSDPQSLHSLVAPRRSFAASEPDAPVKPVERPTAPPQREDPRYPTHTPPKPDAQPGVPCPGTDDPDEPYPACRLALPTRYSDRYPISKS